MPEAGSTHLTCHEAPTFQAHTQGWTWWAEGGGSRFLFFIMLKVANWQLIRVVIERVRTKPRVSQFFSYMSLGYHSTKKTVYHVSTTTYHENNQF